MRKFVLGLIFGFGLSLGTLVFASNSIETLLFPVKYTFNGMDKQLDEAYVTLNYKGHAYVCRFDLCQKI